jgi:predicted nucleic acid-binding protein
VSVLDASVLIAHFNTHDPHHSDATAFLAAHAADDLWIGPLNLAEVLVGPARAGALGKAAAAIEQVGVSEVALPPDGAVRLAELRAATSLKLPDCCVLLTAQQTGTEVVTFDHRLRIAAEELGLQVHPW